MWKIWQKVFGTAALTFLLCLTGMAMTGEAQAQRFTDNGNGTVTDTVTGLMWTKDANVFGKALFWHNAMSRCESFSISGIGGWRMPSSNELVALSDAIKGGHPFTGTQSSHYWSSTTEGNIYAQVVYMINGKVTYGYKTFDYLVWPVRAGQ